MNVNTNISELKVGMRVIHTKHFTTGTVTEIKDRSIYVTRDSGDKDIWYANILPLTEENLLICLKYTHEALERTREGYNTYVKHIVKLNEEYSDLNIYY